MKKWTVLLLFFVNFSTFAVIDALDFQSTQQEDDYHFLTQQLRCPQCQNNNIADSNAAIAVDMRAKVFKLLQQGKSKQNIVDYMVQRYGHFVTYKPPVNITTISLWLIPALLAIFGIVFVFRRQTTQTSQAINQLSETDSQRLQSILNNKEQE